MNSLQEPDVVKRSSGSFIGERRSQDCIVAPRGLGPRLHASPARQRSSADRQTRRAFRLFMIPVGYGDGDDASSLHSGPTLKIAQGFSQPGVVTLTRVSERGV